MIFLWRYPFTVFVTDFLFSLFRVLVCSFLLLPSKTSLSARPFHRLLFFLSWTSHPRRSSCGGRGTAFRHLVASLERRGIAKSSFSQILLPASSEKRIIGGTALPLSNDTAYVAAFLNRSRRHSLEIVTRQVNPSCSISSGESAFA